MMDERSTIKLVAGDSRATISPLGAELRMWSVAGRDLLWEPDPNVWPAVSPILFPIVGRVQNNRLRCDGRFYPMDVHGFAAASVFDLACHARDAARFVLRAPPDLYPYRLALNVDYRLREQSLEIALGVLNEDDRPAYYACGLHPGFRWPFDGGARDSYRIEFDAAERADVPQITPSGFFADGRRDTPLQGRTLALSSDLLAQEALCFLDAQSRGLRFIASSGRTIRIETEDFPHLALWSRPPAPYLCIESWTGHGDPETFEGELSEKPAMRSLAPGATARHAARFVFE